MSQEYTPVSWQDETTSQQGTLINAERLNQMQTAHHYADGFEEVDEIPTEDPGTSYHKIVYCTEDAAFYRWDGTQWAKDVDDVTRAELDAEIERAEHAEGLIQGYLDAHEANHNNPHQVTKAQVGLGNCDNTADADKPISTATQAALDTKADKATTLAGYGITDAYTKAQADTLLADKADKADVYDKTAADTLLAGKVDKLVSSPAGTYKSVTVNAQGQVTAGTNPDTLAGFGITDAYTKAQADTLLATKADTTALTDGSVTKVGTADLGTDTKPIKLVAGVPTAVGHDLVTTDTTQTITADKTINGILTKNVSNNAGKDIYLNSDLPARNSRGSSTIDLYPIIIGKTSGNPHSNILFEDSATARKLAARMYCVSTNGWQALEFIDDSTGPHITAPSRTYNPANTTDVATIGTLDAYSPMVRTTGNQVASGIKAMWTPYYNGSVPSSTSAPNDYMDLGKVFNEGSFGNISLVINGRADYFMGIITGSHDSNTDTLQSSYVGFYSETGKLGLYFAKFDDGIHLLIRRLTAAGQGVSISVFNIGNVTSAPDVTPALTYPTVTITNQLIQEIIVL